MVDLQLGDSLELMKKIPDHSVDLIITDPPYKVATGQGGGTVGKKVRKLSDDLEADNLHKGYDIRSYAEEFRRICKDGMNLYIWCNKAQLMDYLNIYVNEYKYNFNILSWHKTNPLPTFGHKYMSDTEYCLNFFTRGHNDPKQYQDAFTYYTCRSLESEKKMYGHPTIKPVEFIEKMIRNSSKEGDVVLDCFMGSGTTGLAAVKNNRSFIGIEILEKYYELSKNRIAATSSEVKIEKKEQTGFKFGGIKG